MKSNTRRAAQVVWLLAALVSGALSSVALAQEKAAKIDELMSVYQEYGQFNGSVLVAEGGKVIYKKGFGLANMEWNIANQPDTKFRVGSITKQFTAMLVLQLVDRGKLKLDGKITDYLPDYPKKTGDRITIHHLLNHTSGIPSYTGLPGYIVRARVGLLSLASQGRDLSTRWEFAKEVFADRDLEFEPGSKFNYNNSGYFLLGIIIENVSGLSYEKALQQHIFDPLNMKSTGYDLHKTVLLKRATGYDKTLDGYQTAPYLDMSIPYAAGSLYSTVEDLYLWDQALYTDKLLSPERKRMMFQPHLENYAYGWDVRKVPQDQPGAGATMISHGGGISGFNTLIVRLVDSKDLIVLFNNTGPTRLGDISRGIRHVLRGQPYEKPKRPLAEVLYKTLSEADVPAAIRQYQELKKHQPDEYDFREPELGRLGQHLMRNKRAKDAIEVLRLNVEAYPKSAFAHTVLGSAYMEAGEYESAVKSYARALELNPKSTQAIEMLKKLSDKMK